MSRTTTLICASALFAGAVLAQQTAGLHFTYQGPTDKTPVAVGPGGTISFPATNAGSSSNIQLVVTNQGTSAVQIASVASGSPAFSALPNSLTIPGGQSGSFTVSFTANTTGNITTLLTLAAADGSSIVFNLTGTGIAPKLVTSYTLLPGGNQTAISDGGTIPFGQTIVAQTATATISITNQGTAPGTVSSASISGAASFKISGLPLLPAAVDPGTTLSFSVVFTPTTADSVQGSLQIGLGSATETITLTGQGQAAAFKYEVITSTGATAYPINSTIPFGQLAVGSNMQIGFRVTNTGNGSGSITAVSLVGPAFQITNLLPLPVSLAVGASLTFNVTFTPTTPGPLSAQLVINGATFNLTGTGQGAQLTFNLAVGSSTTSVLNGGTVSFPNTVAGATVSGAINIQNTGNLPGTVNSISITGAAFGATIPALPAQITAGSTLSIPVSFTPTGLGTLTGTFGVDNQTFALRGIGTAPPSLPAYSFSGVGSSANPADQPSIGLSLASAYSTDLTGTLTLGFSPASVVDDPAIQYVSGGRTVNFRIPAGTTTALFGTSNATSIQFQSGTVAGTITFTPSFATSGVSVTPQSPPAQSVTVAAAAPFLQNVRLGVTTASSFELLISGYSTGRSVSQIQLQFTGNTGANLQTTSLTVQADSAFSSWYQSATSATAGSQFTASVVISINGSYSAVHTVAVTASNAKGNSNVMSATIQ
jgi:hypothetical protein